MPRVPTYSQPQTQAAALPGVRQSSSPPPIVQVGAEAAQQTMEMGRAISHGANSLARIQIEAQAQANQLRVDDAVNKAKEAAMRYTYDPQVGYLNIKGESALNRESGKPLSDEYSGKLGEDLKAISDGLGNDAQRAAFSRYSGNISTQFHGQVMSHEGGEFRSYRASVREGTIANRTNDIALNYNNPQLITENLNDIKASVYDLGRLNGWSAEKIEAQQRDATSVAHRTALAAALQKNDVSYADQYLKRFAKDMNADDILRVSGLITKDMNAKAGLAAAQTAVAGVLPRFMPSDSDRLVNLVATAESGNRERDDNGTLITSPAGAQGKMQVMPGTNRDPGFGVTPARDDSDAERTRVGKDYLAAMLKKYDGSLSHALAAYNAGPASVDKALSEAKSKGDDANWMKYLPKPQETVPYVNKILTAYGAGQGTPAPPTRAEVMAQVRQSVGEGNPERLQIALEAADRQFTLVEKDVKTREDRATADAMRELVTNGGSYTALPLSVRAAIPAESISKVMDFGKKIAVGNDVTNPAVYQRLSDPVALNRLTDDQFYAMRGELSQSDWQTFARQRAPKADPTEKLNSTAISSVLKSRLASIGYDTSPKDGTPDAAKMGVLRQFIDGTILQQQKVIGKTMTDAEVEKHIDKLMATSVEVKGWFSNSQTRLLSTDAGDIPGDIKTSLKADFKRAGIDSPSDADLWGAYLNLRYQGQRTREALSRLPREGNAFDLTHANIPGSPASGQW